MNVAIANDWGNVDVRQPLHKGYVHVRGDRLGPLCEKLSIKYAKALVDWSSNKYGAKPVIDGVVVSTRSAPKLLKAIEERACNPKRLAAAKRAAKRRNKEREALREKGIDPDSRTAKALKKGEIDIDHAELIQWKAAYRHSFTDYEKQFHRPNWKEGETREDVKNAARILAVEEPIPGTWAGYLEFYDFSSPVSQALATTLREPGKCHPCWFKEAEIAVRRAALDLTALTYEQISQAVKSWRNKRNDGDQGLDD